MSNIVRHKILSHSASSSSLNEAKSKALSLYRAWWREAPNMVINYALEIPVNVVRNKIRELFLANRHCTDLKVLDRIVIKGRMELEETHKIFKQKTHVLRFFDEYQPTPKNVKRDFLTRFYEGN
eukprot:Sdes_comp17952_c0_seq1m7210